MNSNPTTIFIVDDDIFLLDIYAARFSGVGFTVTTAQSGREALEKMRSGFSPDVLLLDVVMPAMDGFELLEALENEGLARNALKIYLTNLSREEDMLRGKALGAVGYIIKASSTPSEVVEEVKKILSTVDNKN
jgi:CheY-like chemotaxis protein